MSRLLILAASALLPMTLLAGCGGPDCGPGSHADGKRCVGDLDPASVCAPGTHLSGSTCLPDFQCGAGTKAVGDTCVADPGAGSGPTIWGPSALVVDTWCAEPQIAVDSQGTIYAVCMSTSFVALFKSADGQSFTELARYPATGSFNGDVTVAVDNSDRVFFAWIDYTNNADGSMSGEAKAVVFAAGGTAPSEAQTVSPTDASFPFNDRPWLNLAPDGSMYLSFIHGTESQQGGGATGALYAISSNGQPFGATVTMRPASTLSMALVTSPIAFCGSGIPCTIEQYYEVSGGSSYTSGLRSVRRTGSGPWAVGGKIAGLDTFPHFSFDPYPSIASDHRFRATVAFVDAPSRKPTLFITRSTDGIAWSTPIAPNVDWMGDQHFPWVTTDENDNVHVLFLDNRGGHWQAYTLSSKDGATFGPIQRVSDAPFNETGGQQDWIGDFNGLVARNGKLYAIWTDLRSGQSRTRVAIAKNPLIP